MIVLAIDPGTACGWAVLRAEAPASAAWGTWDLRPRRHESSGMRFVKLRASLCDLLNSLAPVSPLVAYEEVARHAGTHAAHVYAGIVSTLQVACEDRGLEYIGIPVGRVKKCATGKGNSNKDAMLAAARARFGAGVETHDQADALFIGWAALEEVGAR